MRILVLGSILGVLLSRETTLCALEPSSKWKRDLEATTELGVGCLFAGVGEWIPTTVLT